MTGSQTPSPSPDPAPQRTAERCAAALLAGDRASAGLGITLDAVAPGFARLRMTVRSDMLNGHGICHGGLLFALADTAFAVACNTYEAATVAAAGAIEFLRPAHAGEELTAEARERWRSRRSGIYDITVTGEAGRTVALLRGRSHCLAQAVTPPAPEADAPAQRGR